MIRRFCLAVLMLLLCAGAASAGYIEPDSLKEKVAKGELPPVDARLPADPLRVDLSAEGKTPANMAARCACSSAARAISA